MYLITKFENNNFKKMKILIIGAGLSGCSLGRLLTDKGHEVSIIEKKNFIGGLCITRVDKDGIKFEPFGARTFHTKNEKIKKFITRFDEFNGYTHRKGMIINGKTLPFPMSKQALDQFEEKEKIQEELDNRPKEIDKTNFETACISIFGKTLYSYFVENYTTKMWGMDPKCLTAEWAPKRLEFRNNGNDELFQGQWTGLPKKGYSFLLEKIAEGIPIQFKTTEYNPDDYDVVVTSAPIDQILDYKFGRLKYRSIKFKYKYDKTWEKDNYGTMNLPQHSKYIRKCNFKILHKQKSPYNRVQYQEPIEAGKNNMPMYPINTKENDEQFDQYLKEICKSEKTCPLGRLGLFKYLDMDKAVEVAFDMVPIVENYLKLRTNERYEMIKEIRNRY